MIEIVSKHPGPWYRFRRPVVLARLEADTLEGAQLGGRQLAGAGLRGQALNRADLSGASLAGADLWGAKLTSANLEGAQLSGADLSGAVLITANLCGARLDQCNLWGANLAGARLVGASLAGAELSGARLAPAQLTEANLNGARLTNAYLVGAHLDAASLRGATLAEADCSGASLCRANLFQANLEQARLSEADLTDASLREALLARATLSSAILERADLQRAVLRQADLTGANLRSAQLSAADLEGAVLVRADLTDATADAARFHHADLRGACLCGARFHAARMDDVDAREINGQMAILTEASLCRANLAGAALRRADLRNANLWGAELKGADLRGANLLGASVTAEQLADVISDATTQWPVGLDFGAADQAPGPDASPAVIRLPDAPRVFREHKAAVVDAAISPDGRLGLSGDASGEVLLWDAAQLRTIHHVVLSAPVRSVAFLAESGLALVAGAARPHGGELRLWSIHSLSELLRVGVPRPPLRAAALDPRRVIVATETELEAWDLEAGQAMWRSPLGGHAVQTLGLVCGERRVICATSEALIAFDSDSGEVVLRVVDSAGPFVAAAVSAGMRHAVTVGGDSVLRLWDLDRGVEAARVGLDAAPRWLAVDPAGSHVALIIRDRRLQVLELPGGRGVLSHELPSPATLCLRFSPDGRELLVAGEDHCVRLFAMPKQ